MRQSGRSGDLVFVEVGTACWRRTAWCACASARPTSIAGGRGGGDGSVAAADPPAGERWMPDEVNLFRFSAATFNAHRIHYDRPYATAVEGYPALVIHGPFTAARLAGLAMRQGNRRRRSAPRRRCSWGSPCFSRPRARRCARCAATARWRCGRARRGGGRHDAAPRPPGARGRFRRSPLTERVAAAWPGARIAAPASGRR
ncbi:hypothetical protein AB5I41_17680 [Sphingomonas sp. MMS24-JH45]